MKLLVGLMLFDTEKGVLYIDLERDLSALNTRPAQVRAVIHRESEVSAPESVKDTRLRSSMKARSKGNAVLLVVSLGILT